MGLEVGLEIGEAGQLRQDEEEFRSQSGQDLVVIGSAMPNNSSLSQTNLYNYGIMAGSSSSVTNALVRS